MFRIRKHFTLVSSLLSISGYASNLWAFETAKVDPQVLGTAATRLIIVSDYQNGIRLLEKAIEANSQYCITIEYGDSYEREGALDLAFGAQQLNRMLEDRPPMKKYLKEGDLLWTWARDRFAGTACCGPIFWDPTEPLAKADHSPATKFSPARIRVSQMSQTPPLIENLSDSMWSGVVYESFNSCYGTYYQSLFEKGISGELSKKEFVKGVFMMEMKAIDDTREFYKESYLSWAEQNHAKTNPTHWFVNRWWGDKEQLFDSCVDREAYPWVPYGNYYDGIDQARRILRLEGAAERGPKGPESNSLVQ